MPQISRKIKHPHYRGLYMTVRINDNSGRVMLAYSSKNQSDINKIREAFPKTEAEVWQTFQDWAKNKDIKSVCLTTVTEM